MLILTMGVYNFHSLTLRPCKNGNSTPLVLVLVLSLSPYIDLFNIDLISIYKFDLYVCLSVCLFVSNKRQNGWTDRAQIFCVTSRDPREGLWKIKISNICLHQNSIVIKLLKILKIREIFCENPQIIFILFYDVHKENMFTTNLEDEREAPSKASIVNMSRVRLNQRQRS